MTAAKTPPAVARATGPGATGGRVTGKAGTGPAKDYDVDAIRAEFPILHQQVHGWPLVYLDNAATTQKPRAVMDAERHYYEADNANIHRGVHELSQRATRDYEATREKVRAFLNAPAMEEIIFVRGTTEAINLVAQTHVRAMLQPGDEVVIGESEHHSNIVPWQMVCADKDAALRVIPIDDTGALRMDEYQRLLSERTRFVSVAHVSNALGTVNPVEDIIRLAHERGAQVLLDGAQAAPHLAVDVQALGCDFYAISSHKMYGPTGVGVLWGRRELLEAMPPYQGGGDMISSVTFDKTTYNDLPYKFEAGTPNIAGVIGFGAAIDWLQAVGLDAVAAHEHDLLEYATGRLGELPEVRIIGTAPHKAAVISFTVEGIHPHDVGSLLDRAGIAIRTGHHCAQPTMAHFQVAATNRASFAAYNTHAEVDALVDALQEVIEVFR